MAPRFVYRLLSEYIVSALPLCIRRGLWQYLAHVGAQCWACESATQRIPGGMYVKCTSSTDHSFVRQRPKLSCIHLFGFKPAKMQLPLFITPR
ncbi:hypothetical protein C2E23DRAFT_812786 [Lenzites betulinus]|nr:hypothetical protein C2E23DRAFT_812786 [Lenzites betulinus]